MYPKSVTLAGQIFSIVYPAPGLVLADEKALEKQPVKRVSLMIGGNGPKWSEDYRGRFVMSGKDYDCIVKITNLESACGNNIAYRYLKQKFGGPFNNLEILLRKIVC